MAYRNDLEALEVRYRVLDSELAHRTRERDEVKQMLDEARDYNDWVERRPRRRALRRRITILVFAAAAVIATIGSVMMSGHRTRHFEDNLEKFSGFTDRLCACTTKVCADGIHGEISRWAETIAKDDRASDKPSDEDIKRITVVSERYGKCLTKLQGDGRY